MKRAMTPTTKPNTIHPIIAMRFPREKGLVADPPDEFHRSVRGARLLALPRQQRRRCSEGQI